MADSLLRMGTFVVLARYLTPAEFAVFTIATVLIALSGVLSSAGMRDVVIRDESPDEELKNTVFWANFGLAALLAVVVAMLSPFIAAAYNNQSMMLVICSLAVTLVLPPLWTMGGALAFRNLEVKKLEAIALAASVANSVASICVAIVGGGVWALVAGSVSFTLVSLVLTRLYFPWTPRLQFSLSRFKSIAGFSGNMLASQILRTLIVRLQELISSVFLSLTAVGHYRVGTRFMEIIGEGVLNPIAGLGLSAFVHVRDDLARLSSAYERMVATSAIVYVPMIVGFAAVADEAVPMLFGAQWLPSIPVVQILSLLAPATVLAYYQGSMLSAIGRSDVLRNITLLQFAGTVTFSAVGAQFGIVGLAVSFLLRSYCTLPLQMHWLSKASGVRPDLALLAAGKPFVAALLMAAAIRIIRPTLYDYDLNEFVQLIVLCSFGAIVYVLVLAIVFKRYLVEHVRGAWTLLRSA